MLRSNDRRARSAKPKVCQRGEACPHAKLTWKLVRRIRRMYVPNRFGSKRIVEALAGDGISVNRRTVDGVIGGRTWREP